MDTDFKCALRDGPELRRESEWAGPPILEIEENIKSQKYPDGREIWYRKGPRKPDTREVVGRKCNCGSSWCIDCFLLRAAPKISERLQGFNWRSTRQIVLSIDRSQFKSGKEAHHHITTKKLIPGLIRNLERTIGVEVKDWVRVLEWHWDGFPHWHLFIDVGIEGKEGMIGGDVIRHYWPWARWIREEPIKSERHWNNLIGYFRKNGYFEKDKAHQAQLPEWALEESKRIKRYGSKAVQKRIGNRRERGKDKAERRNKQQRTYREILESCGAETYVTMLHHGVESFGRRINMPYAEFRRLEGEYIEGLGYVPRMSWRQFGYYLECPF